MMGEEAWPGLHLSQLGHWDAKGALSKVTRDPLTIREGTRRQIDLLRSLRTVDGQERAAGIVFCGNDTEPDKVANKHAEQIKAQLLAFDPRLEVVIATMARGNGSALVKEFRRRERPIGDILIVKQMASLGLDCPRIKITLDLSTVRTPASLSSMMRGRRPQPEPARSISRRTTPSARHLCCRTGER
jgi:hypothetical protein